MKRLLVLLLILLFALPVLAKDITLVWDANTESDLEGYRVYRSLVIGGQETGLASPDLVDIIVCPPNHAACCIYDDLNVSDTVPYYYIVTAFDVNEKESGKSNEVTSVILPPTNFGVNTN